MDWKGHCSIWIARTVHVWFGGEEPGEKRYFEICGTGGRQYGSRLRIGTKGRLMAGANSGDGWLWKDAALAKGLQ